jgi:hypothetical protein
VLNEQLRIVAKERVSSAAEQAMLKAEDVH